MSVFSLILLAAAVGVFLAAIHEIYLYYRNRSLSKRYKELLISLDDNKRLEDINKKLEEKLKFK